MGGKKEGLASVRARVAASACKYKIHLMMALVARVSLLYWLSPFFRVKVLQALRAAASWADAGTGTAGKPCSRSRDLLMFNMYQHTRKFVRVLARSQFI